MHAWILLLGWASVYLAVVLGLLSLFLLEELWAAAYTAVERLLRKRR
jgi:hypothetical protein